jgi:hypothetical protein
MGCVSSNLTADEIDKRKKNKLFESELAAQSKLNSEKVKLLLLGAGNIVTWLNLFISIGFITH